MSRKLFDTKEQVAPVIPIQQNITIESYDSFDEDIRQLENLSKAHESIQDVFASIATEDYSGLNKVNATLFNELTKQISLNLGVEVPSVSVESLDELSGASKQQFALEGFIKNMWEKIKGFFRKIYEGLKSFFKGIFTRIGRVEKRLKNIQTTVTKTDKDLKTFSLDKVPGKMTRAFPKTGHIDSNDLKSSLSLFDTLTSVIKTTTEEGDKLAKKDILGREFVSEMKHNLDNLKQSTKDQIESEASRNLVGKAAGALGFKKDKSLQDLRNEQIKQSNSDQETLSKVSLSGSGTDSDEVGQQEAKQEVHDFYKKVSEATSRIKDKTLPGGKMLKEIKVTENGLELEFEDRKEEPTGIDLIGKQLILASVKTALDNISTINKVMDTYGKVNDTINNKLDDIDRLMSDIDRATDNPDAKRYGKVLEKKVRVRLKILQNFFKDFNKVNKNLVSATLDISEGVADYSVTSLKYFG